MLPAREAVEFFIGETERSFVFLGSVKDARPVPFFFPSPLLKLVKWNSKHRENISKWYASDLLIGV
jgi:hypothetical protein